MLLNCPPMSNTLNVFDAETTYVQSPLIFDTPDPFDENVSNTTFTIGNREFIFANGKLTIDDDLVNCERLEQAVQHFLVHAKKSSLTLSDAEYVARVAHHNFGLSIRTDEENKFRALLKSNNSSVHKIPDLKRNVSHLVHAAEKHGFCTEYSGIQPRDFNSFVFFDLCENTVSHTEFKFKFTNPELPWWRGKILTLTINSKSNPCIEIKFPSGMTHPLWTGTCDSIHNFPLDAERFATWLMDLKPRQWE